MPPVRSVAPVQLDLSGCVHSKIGLNDQQINDHARLAVDQVASIAAGERGEFFLMPEHHADQYASLREGSSLGKIFTIANRLHDQVDAVVVVGERRTMGAARVLMHGCCDPYHNELDRGQRGSKPRMYFLDECFDNDSVAALLHRLEINQVDQSAAQARWSLVVVDDGGREQSAGLQRLAQKWIEQIKLANDDTWTEQVFVISPRPDATTNRLGLVDWVAQHTDSVFTIPELSDCRSSVLTAATLLPAAMLGLDCMKLAEGALQLNQHFVESPPEQNLPLRWWTVRNQLAQLGFAGAGVWVIDPVALKNFSHWYHNQMPVAESPIDFSQSARSLSDLSPRPVTYRMTVRTHRHDPCLGSDLDTHLRAQRTSVAQSLADARQPVVGVELATIDTFHLGYLFQMMLVSDSFLPTT